MFLIKPNQITFDLFLNIILKQDKTRNAKIPNVTKYLVNAFGYASPCLSDPCDFI